jgi:hypothetical protein
LVDGIPHQIFRHDPGAAAGGHRHASGAAREINRDIDRGVSEADDEHELALEGSGRAVIV